jgi:hypothetical protein
VALLKLFNERVEAKAAGGVFEPSARGAFRALGLGATAARGEVFDAASSVRLALKLGVRKTFESDAAWLLGPAAREESDVRDAVGRLTEPVQRARERLFWFRTPPPAPVSTVAQLSAAVDALLAGGGAEALHDAALLALCGLMRFDPTLREAGAWARAFGLWRRVFECEEFWSLLVAADLRGDYEQPVTFGEVAELRRGAPRVVAGHVAARARAIVLRGNLREAAHALDLLRGAGLPAALLQEYENEVVGPAEDALTEELDKAFAWVTGLGFTPKTAATRRNYANEAWRKFDGLRPRLAEFAELAGAGSYPARRVFEQAASKLLRLAASFEEAGRPAEALFICRAARPLAPRGSDASHAVGEKLRALGAPEGPPAGEADGYAAALARGLADARVPRKLFRDDPRGDRTFDSYASGDNADAGCLTSVAFWVAAVVACFGLQWCGVIKTGPRRTPVESLPPLNMRPNLNFSIPNLNYNIPPPLNLRPYTDPPPRGTRRPGGRRRRLPPPETVVPPPTTVERTPNANATPRE